MNYCSMIMVVPPTQEGQTRFAAAIPGWFNIAGPTCQLPTLSSSSLIANIQSVCFLLLPTNLFIHIFVPYLT